MPDWIAALLAGPYIGVLVVLVLMVIGAVRTWPWLRRLVRFVDALIGDDQHPGVLDRLTHAEERIERIHHEVTPNTGGSIKDAVSRTETKIDEVESKLKIDYERLSDLEDTITNPRHRH